MNVMYWKLKIILLPKSYMSIKRDAYKIHFSDLIWVSYFYHDFTIFFLFKGTKSNAFFHNVGQM